MGLLFKNIVRVFELIYDEAEKEYYDDTPYKEWLNELYVMLEKGEITEEEYEIEEEKVLVKLREIRDYKKGYDREESDENE